MHLYLIHNENLDGYGQWQRKGRYGMKNIWFKKGLHLAFFLVLSLLISVLTFTAVALVERALTG
jgi:hypothetical protein